MPCFNEEKRLPIFCEKWKAFVLTERSRLESLISSFDLVFVDDGSMDGTSEILQKLQKTLLEMNGSGAQRVRLERLNVNQGKGAAVRRGLEVAAGDLILITDADLSAPLKEFFKLVSADVDLAFGSRAVLGSFIVKKQSGIRPQLGRLFNSFMRLVTGLPYRDTQCGFKLIRRTLAHTLLPKLQENRFAFDVEMILLASKAHATIAEVPIEWAHDESSRVSVLKDGIQMALKTLEIAIRSK